MSDTIRYEIAPIFEKSFLLADPILRRHMVRIGILEYEKAVLECVDLAQVEQTTQCIITKINDNRSKMVHEYEEMLANIQQTK